MKEVLIEIAELKEEIDRLRSINEEMENDFYDHEQSF